MKHTKGKFTDGHTGWKMEEIPNPYADTPHYGVHYSDDGECIAEWVHEKKDAQLISKAPDMLAMLQDISDTLANGDTPHVYQIDQLIKEATS